MEMENFKCNDDIPRILQSIMEVLDSLEKCWYVHFRPV